MPLSHFPRHQNVADVFVVVAIAAAAIVAAPQPHLEFCRMAKVYFSGERGKKGRGSGEEEESEAVSRTSFICITMINSKVCAREFLNIFFALFSFELLLLLPLLLFLLILVFHVVFMCACPAWRYSRKRQRVKKAARIGHKLFMAGFLAL